MSIDVTYEPVRCIGLRTGTGMPVMRHYPENAGETFELGVPVTLASGLVQECAFGGAELVLGFSAEAAHNLAVDGTRQDLSEGTPPNQPNAVTTPVGAWLREGMCMVYVANEDALFSAVLTPGQVFTQALVGATRYAMKKDGSSGFWYIDPLDSGTNDEHIALIERLDDSSPNTAGGGARVIFRVAPAARQLG